jgi:3-oxoacyl-[acyl-carrier protein] reductase
LGLRNRRALVTGAAAGLAAGIAAALARDDFAHVAITYRATPPGETIATIEAASGARTSAQRVDFLADERTIARSLEELSQRDGPFDTLVHGVGPLVVGRFERATIGDYREAFDGNVRSAVLAAQAVLPAMRAASFGRIVFFAMLGSAETRPFRSLALYAAKSALVAFARTLAVEEASHDITINVVSVGDIREKTLTREQARHRAANNPRGRPGSYEDVADAVRFFVAGERDFITGAVLDVTGGLQSAAE